MAAPKRPASVPSSGVSPSEPVETPAPPSQAAASGAVTPAPPTQAISTVPGETIPPSIAPSGGGPRAGFLSPVEGFEVLGELGRGGMGVVYKARDSFKRVVALKMIKAGMDADDEERRRFRSEAEAAARLQHPNIVQVFAWGEQGGQAYFSQEFCAGGSLEKKLGDDGVLGAAESAGLVETLARAMHHAHQQGVVHRDLKPANVLLGLDGTPKVADFGLAKKLDDDSGQTRSGAIMGTPNYMAPEQAAGRSKELGPACDVYALGAILYECLTGRPPFRAATVMDTLMQVIHDDPVPPRRQNRKTPRDLETICLKCLEKDQKKRYGSAAELADDLRRFLNFEPIRARPVGRMERAARWMRKRPATVVATLAMVLVLITGAVGYWMWKQREDARKLAETVQEANEEKVEYYASLVRRFGEPEGLEPLSEEEAFRRVSSYRFTSKGGKVIRIDILNSNLPIQYAYLMNPSRWVLNMDVRFNLDYVHPDDHWHFFRERSQHFLRDEDGRLVSEEMRDVYGKLYWACTWISRERVCRVTENQERSGPAARETRYYKWVWESGGFPREVWETDADGRVLHREGKWSGIRVHTDGNGQLDKLSRLDERGSEHPFIGDAVAFLFERDHRGRIVGINPVKADGHPASFLLTRASVLKITHHETGQVDLGVFDSSGRPATLIGICHRLTLQVRQQGREVESLLFGISGQRVADPAGVHRYARQYDGQGNLIDLRAYDAFNKPRIVKADPPVARMTRRFDERGTLLQESLFVVDQAGDYVLCSREDYQERAYERSYFTSDGHQTVHPKAGNHRVTWRCDERGHRIEEAYYGLDGKPIRSLDGGTHRWTGKYDERGHQVEAAFFDVDGKAMLSWRGRHRWTARYNGAGKQIEELNYGVDGRPVRDRDDSVRITWEYDPEGKLRERCWWTLTREGKLVPRLRRDARNNVTEEALFDRDGQPTLHAEGWHRCTSRYDAHNKLCERAFFGSNGEPVLNKLSGQHRWTERRDERGNVTEGRNFDTDGKPMGSRSGGAPRWTARYDGANNQVELAYFDTDEQPTLSVEGFHKRTATYNARNNITEQLHYGINGQLIRDKTGTVKVTWEYDREGKLREMCSWTLTNEGKIVPLLRRDARNNVTEESLFDREFRPILHQEGWHRRSGSYDTHGKLSELAFFGLNGEPVLNKQGGQHRWTERRDERGNVIEGRNFDTDGKPIRLRSRGFHKWTANYDSANNQVEEACFDTDDRPILSVEGFHKRMMVYNPRNQITEQTYHGIDGRLIRDRTGSVKITWEYDPAGKLRETCCWALTSEGKLVPRLRRNARDNVTEEALFDRDGRPTLHMEGWHRYTSRYDAHNKLCERAFFGSNGEPVLNRQGQHRWTERRDERGNPIEGCNFGTRGEPVLHKPSGVHRWTARYDDKNRLVERCYFDVNGKPTRHSQFGFHKAVWSYDPQGTQTSSFFDVDGRPIEPKKQ